MHAAELQWLSETLFPLVFMHVWIDCWFLIAPKVTPHALQQPAQEVMVHPAVFTEPWRDAGYTVLTVWH